MHIDADKPADICFSSQTQPTQNIIGGVSMISPGISINYSNFNQSLSLRLPNHPYAGAPQPLHMEGKDYSGFL